MIHKLLIICCLFSTQILFAQTGQNFDANLKQMGVTGPVKMVPHSNIAPDPTDYKAVGSPLPTFIVQDVQHKIYTNKDVQYNGNLLVMIFNPTCSHCEAMTDMLEKNIKLFSKSKVLMVATAGQEPYLKDFEERHHTADYPTMKVTFDSSKMTDRLFNYKMLPQINVYDRDRKLIKTLNGTLPIDSFKAYIQ